MPSKSIYEKYLPALPDRDVNTEVRVKAGRIVQAFVYADLRLMLPGLLKIMKEHGLDPKNLKPGMCVPFVNTKRTAVKVIVGNGTDWPVLACYHMPPGTHMPYEAVCDIFQAFNALTDTVRADERLAKVLERYAQSKRKERLTLKQLRDVTPNA